MPQRAIQTANDAAEPFRVLVIDDDPGVRDYMEALVSRQGFRVFLAADAEQALSGLDDTRPDIVTLDVVLPGMDGLETLRRLKQRAPNVPVVMLSGHGQARNIVEAMRLGASDFLRKPFEVEELELAFQKALEKRALKQEVERLRGRARSETELLLLCGDNQKMREVREIIEQVADTDITVLVRGESGTGKELVARTIFQLSGRRDQPFVKVNCAALPSELLESELFGFEKGAFTGAQKRKLGKFEYANHGAIFLDEISEMHPALQAKLLQVLQDGEFSRLGGESDVHVDTRVIAATNRNLEEAVADGSFREDLYYRLNVVTVHLPPLRDRVDGIPLLVDHFLRKNNEQYRKELKALSTETMDIFMKYHWPGNVRELENMVRRMVVLGNESTVLEEISLRGSAPTSRSAPSDNTLDLGALHYVPLNDLGNGAFELATLREQLKEMLADSQAFHSVEVPHVVTAEGERTLIVDAHPLSFPGHSERRVLVTFQDITARKQAEAAKDLRSAKMAPIIGAAFKMLVPFIVILPGLLALALLPVKLTGETAAIASGGHSYNEVLPLMLARYCGPGLLGLGITALIAGFMSGMAGNVSAFTTVWTYDIYRALINKRASDHHYVNMGRWCTVLGVLISVGTAYLVMSFASIMDYVQALFSFFIAPLFGTVILGMLWKRATGPGGFWGLLAGTLSSIGMWAWVKVDPSALRYVALSPNARDMAENMYRALWSWIVCVLVTIVVSYATRPKPERELAGLVYGVTKIPREDQVPIYQRPLFWAVVVSVLFVVLNILVW